MDSIVVLMSTYNGEKYLQDQLDSLYNQTGVTVNIVIRDDGSTDQTHEILEKNQTRGSLTWYAGENLKSAWSFMDLMFNAPESQWYAFCDQDDIWISDKLQIAINKMKDIDPNLPILYYGHPRLVDEELNAVKSSTNTYDRMMDFYSSMINSNATGCTMVFNKSLIELVKRERPSYIAMHDGWIHKLCIAARGVLIYDEDVHILYRQHANNVIGSSNSIKKKIAQRIHSLINKECIRSRTITSLVECYSDLMNEEELRHAKIVASYKAGIKNRLALLLDRKIKTNYFRRNFLFKLAVITGAF